MVDEAPPPEAVLPELARLLRGRVLVAHSARFDLGVLRGAFSRAALDWPEPPVLCTVAMARRFAPLQRRRGLAALADALGHRRRRRPTARCPTRRRARACSARCSAGSPRTRRRSATRSRCSRRGAGGGARRPRAGARRRPPSERPDFSSLPARPGRVRVPRRRRPAALRRQVGLPADPRARALHDARGVDGPRRARRLPGDASPSWARCCSRTG